jgi:hypothetical protein
MILSVTLHSSIDYKTSKIASSAYLITIADNCIILSI